MTDRGCWTGVPHLDVAFSWVATSEEMAQRPSVRWNERNERWMAWVRFPAGSRRKVERTDKAEAQHDLDELLALRAQALDPGPRRQRSLTFSEVIDAWFEAGCPNVAPSRTSRRSWNYLNQACQHALRKRSIKRNPAADVLLPARKPSKPRKSFTIEQAQKLLADAIPADPRPAMWLTALMCGLRPGELAGLRWCYVDLDSEEPTIEVAERAMEVGKKYVGQGPPKTERSKRRIGLHPLLVAALLRHREESRVLGLYDQEGFVFGTRNGTPMAISNLRRAFNELSERAGLGSDWTTYELRHSFVSLVADQLDDLVKVADLAGHVDTRTTEGYRHQVRPSIPHAIEAWNRLLDQAES